MPAQSRLTSTTSRSDVAKTIRIALASLLALVLSFCAGYVIGRQGDNREAGTNYIDSSVLERIRSYQRAELDSERRFIESERAGIEQERARLRDYRSGHGDIERLAQETIGIVKSRAENGKVEN